MVPLYVSRETELGNPLMTKNFNTPDEIVDGETIRRAFSGSVIKSIDVDKRQIEFIISTAAVDRYGDIVEVSGWDLKAYKANPVVLFGHNSSIPPIGKAIKTWKDGDALRSIAEFMPQDISAFAHSIFRMYQEKFLRAVSVGFKPLKWERMKDEEGNETWAYRFFKQELLEFSAVPIPANPEALVAAREKGIDTMPFKSWAEEMLDNWNSTGNEIKSLYGVERKEIENIRRRAAGLGATFKVPPAMQDEIMKRNLEAIRAAKAAKATENTTVDLTIREMDLSLMLLDDKERQKAGTVQISQEEINNKKTLSVDKSDDRALFAKELLDDDNEFIDVEMKEVDGEEVAVVTIKGDNTHVEYELLSANADGDTLLGVKIGEKDAPSLGDIMQAMQDAEVEDLTEEDDVDESKSADSSEDEEEEEEEDKSSKEDDEDEDDDEDDKKSSKSKSASRSDPVEEEDDEPLDFKSALFLLENTLTAVEDILDGESDVKSHGRAYTRKGEFLAGYMRELADRLDGGKKTVTPPAPTKTLKQAPVVEEEEGMSAAEATAYVKTMTEQLQPLLAEMIASKLSKHRGRLD